MEEIFSPSFLASFLNEGVYVLEEKTEPPIKVIEPPPPVKVEETKEPYTPDIEYSGDTKNGIAILVDYPTEKYILLKDKIILEKILKAVNLSMEEVALVNIYKSQLNDIKQLCLQLKVNKGIGFGLTHPVFATLKKDSLIKSDNIDMILCNESLTLLAENREKKAILWANLKSLFHI